MASSNQTDGDDGQDKCLLTWRLGRLVQQMRLCVLSRSVTSDCKLLAVSSLLWTTSGSQTSTWPRPCTDQRDGVNSVSSAQSLTGINSRFGLAVRRDSVVRSHYFSTGWFWSLALQSVPVTSLPKDAGPGCGWQQALCHVWTLTHVLRLRHGHFVV